MNADAVNLRCMHRYERIAIKLPFIFLLFYAGWTVNVHLSQVFGLSWNASVSIFYFIGPLSIILSLVLAKNLCNEFVESIACGTMPSMPRASHVLSSPYFAMFLILGTAVVSMMVASYQVIVLTSVLMTVALFFLPRLVSENEGNTSRPPSEKFFLITMLAYIAIVLVVILFYHRSDLDDVGYLQVIVQTLRHPDLPLLGFDSSLGEIMEGFRFAPYKISSYELFVALVSSSFSIDFLRVYYIWLPLLAGAITVMSAYVFTRWFLPSKFALVAVGIFVLLVIAWGETHIAYGNRLFLRLYQGKGLIIAIGAPLCFISGLMLIRRPSINSSLVFSLSLIGMIGFSSSGLVSSVIVFCVFAAVSLFLVRERKALTGLALVGSILYPIAIYLWLREINIMSVPLSERGTFLPVDSSFGLDIRRSVALASLACGTYFLFARKRIEFFLIVIISIGVVLNPVFTGFVTSLGSANMSWRIAWAIPIPLLVAVGLTSGLMHFGKRFSLKNMTWASILSIVFLLIFLLGGNWVLDNKNNAKFHSPSLKLSEDFYLARNVAKELKKIPRTGSVLAPFEIGNWFPVLLPERKIVMPGHNYPIMHRAYLDPVDYKNRTSLAEIYRTDGFDQDVVIDSILNLEVQQILIGENKKDGVIRALSSSGLFNYTVEEIGFGYHVIEINKQ